MTEVTLNINITDPECIEIIDKLRSLHPKEEDFTKQIELMLKVFQRFVSNSKWEFCDDSAEKLSERMRLQLKDALDENKETLKSELTFIEERISRPMQSEFQKFQESIDQFRGSSKNASSKGKIGEKNIERQIEWYFPECEITDTRSEAEQADYHLTIEDTLMLLEVKTYSKNVPSKEVDKFVRDLTTKTHIKAGIMISSSSGIVKKQKFSYEILASENGPKLAVYVPHAIDNVSGNCVSVVWAILFVLRVMQFQNKKQNSSLGHDNSSDDDMEIALNDSCEIIRHQMSWLEYLVEQNQNSLLMMEKSYRKSVNTLDEWVGECKKGWKVIDDILKQQIQLTRNFLNEGRKELLPLPTEGESIVSSNTWKCSECKKTYKTESNYLKHVEAKHSEVKLI